MAKIISFDMDGTLFDRNFDTALWFSEIPRLYAKSHNVSFEKAKEICMAEYDKETKFSAKWYDIHHWLNHLGIDTTFDKIGADLKHTISVYDDAAPALKSLKKRYKLVLLSAAPAEFIRLKMSVEDLSVHFSKICSSTTDLGAPGKTKNVFRKLMKVLGAKPSDMIHIGDEKDFDFDVPRALGITAYLLDRKKELKKSDFVIHSLKELEGKLL